MGNIFFKKKKEKLECHYESLFDIPAEDIDGEEHRIGELVEGCKCVMVVNVASK